MQDLSAQLARVARDIAATLARAGHRAWIVGGAPRDLVLGRAPVEIDMASNARPEEIEALFARTFPVGRAFGTVVIHEGDLDVQHTTFRSESGYSDARRPDAVDFGHSIEEDSTRRDFTCNALYLDPLTDELQDPQRGLEDLERRRIACVGDPVRRFEEDGLRLMRLARFAAALELEPGPGVLEAARRAQEALRGVSPERVLVELTAIFQQRSATRALELLQTCGLLSRALPGLCGRNGGSDESAAWSRTRRLFAALPAPCGVSLGLAALLDARRAPAADPKVGALADGDRDALEIATALRTSRAQQDRLREIWKIVGSMESAATRALLPARSERLRWMQSPAFDEALALARARALADGAESGWVDDLERERRTLSEHDLHPPPCITPSDLESAGIPRGPQWGKLLREIEALQLDQKIHSREEGLAWVAAQARRDQDGGNTPRKK